MGEKEPHDKSTTGEFINAFGIRSLSVGVCLFGGMLRAVLNTNGLFDALCAEDAENGSISTVDIEWRMKLLFGRQ